MKIKNILLFLAYCLTAALVYGQDVHENDTCMLLPRDTTLWEEDKAAEIYIPPFFSPQQKEPYEEANRTKHAFDWFFIVLFLFSALLAFLRLQNPNIFVLLRQVLSRKKQRDVFLKKENASKNFLSSLLSICSWIGFSLAFAEVLSFFNFTFSFEPLFFTLVIVFFYLFLKYLLRKILTELFQTDNLAAEYTQMTVSTNFVAILISLPLVTINHYVANNYLIWVICLPFCVNFLQKLFFSWIIFSQKLRTFEILLYLCTIELLPPMLLARYIINCF